MMRDHHHHRVVVNSRQHIAYTAGRRDPMGKGRKRKAIDGYQPMAAKGSGGYPTQDAYVRRELATAYTIHHNRGKERSDRKGRNRSGRMGMAGIDRRSGQRIYQRPPTPNRDHHHHRMSVAGSRYIIHRGKEGSDRKEKEKRGHRRK
jgi:hypothetical protein